MSHVAVTTLGLCVLVFLGAPLMQLLLRCVLVAGFFLSHGLEALAAPPAPEDGRRLGDDPVVPPRALPVRRFDPAEARGVPSSRIAA
jgi:hypothetical protein